MSPGLVHLDNYYSGESTARPPASGHRNGEWGSTVKLGAERVGVSFEIAMSLTNTGIRS